MFPFFYLQTMIVDAWAQQAVIVLSKISNSDISPQQSFARPWLSFNLCHISIPHNKNLRYGQKLKYLRMARNAKLSARNAKLSAGKWSRLQNHMIYENKGPIFLLIKGWPCPTKSIYNLIRGRMTTANNWAWRLFGRRSYFRVARKLTMAELQKPLVKYFGLSLKLVGEFCWGGSAYRWSCREELASGTRSAFTGHSRGEGEGQSLLWKMSAPFLSGTLLIIQSVPGCSAVLLNICLVQYTNSMKKVLLVETENSSVKFQQQPWVSDRRTKGSADIQRSTKSRWAETAHACPCLTMLDHPPVLPHGLAGIYHQALQVTLNGARLLAHHMHWALISILVEGTW